MHIIHISYEKEYQYAYRADVDRIPAFALTIAATAVLSQLFNASDLAVVGYFTGSMRNIAVAAVGANSPIVSLILNLFIGSICFDDTWNLWRETCLDFHSVPSKQNFPHYYGSISTELICNCIACCVILHLQTEIA